MLSRVCDNMIERAVKQLFIRPMKSQGLQQKGVTLSSLYQALNNQLARELRKELYR